ncbi:MAG TPA: DUF6600 domain-containing protein [Terracidiphilus sp.]|nr:DUF6600 domain-containing protein [Terracidiphilus sp.]
MRFALASTRLLKWTAVAAALAMLVVPALRAQDMQDQDPPDQAGRISAVQGTVSIQPAGSEDWGQAYLNLPVGPGDRIYTDQDGWAEVQVGRTFVRIGPNTDITLVGDNANSITWGLAQGGVHTRTLALWAGQTLNFSTPNGDMQVNTPGEVRVDAMPNDNVTIFSSLSSNVLVSGAGGYWQQMNNWQSLELAGTNPVYPQWLQPAQQDYLDQWSQQRDQQLQNVYSYRYVNPDMPGASDLDTYGDWTPDSDYGPMWFPRDVPADWQPYHYGHWINRDPWGWVWVEDEPWGYAPFHYGRWVVYRGRWGWVPGPREERPVWSPALVVFAGGIHVGGVGVSAWFPLGPGEAYRPWYRCSPRYVDRVNITNIHESRVVHVQNTYVNVVNVTNVTNVTYINRNVGATAMRQEDFAAGRSARQAAVQVDQRQFNRVQVVDRPAPVMRQSFVARPVAQPIPVHDKTPVFINQQGMQITAKPGATPIAPRVQPVQTPRPVQGRVVVAPPVENRNQNNSGQPQRQFGNQNRPQQNGGMQQQPQQPNQPQQTYQPNGSANQNNRQYQNQQPVQNQPAGANSNQQQQQQRVIDARPVGRPIAPMDDRGPRQMQPEQNGNPGANPNQQPANTQQRQQSQPFQQTAPQQQQQRPQTPVNQQQQEQQQRQQMNTPPQQPAQQARPNAQPQPVQNQQQMQRQQPQQQPQNARPQDQRNNQNQNRDQNKDQKKDQKKDDKKDDRKKD